MIAESKTAAADETRHFLGGRWAVALGISMLAGFSLIVAWSAMDRQKRELFEKWEEVTGVEDKVLFSMPARLNAAPTPAARLGGTPLFLASIDTIGIHDSDVRRVAIDSATSLTIYRPADPSAAHLKGKEVYLLKTESGRYARVNGE